MKDTSVVRRRIACGVGVLLVGLGAYWWLSIPGGNLFLSTGLVGLGLPLIGEILGAKSRWLRRWLLMLVPLGFGVGLGFHVAHLDPAGMGRAMALFSDTFPLFLLLPAILLPLPWTRLTAHLLAAGFLFWFVGFTAGLAVRHPRSPPTRPSALCTPFGAQKSTSPKKVVRLASRFPSSMGVVRTSRCVLTLEKTFDKP